MLKISLVGKTLHIVDGESTAMSLRGAGFRKHGDILSWRDALYTGPVPAGLTLRQLSRLRSRFWTGRNATGFDKRDATLARFADYDEVVLWFGATSLCQLSLGQLLAWFGERGRNKHRLSLVSAYGGWLRPEQVPEACAARRPVTAAQMHLGQRVWAAYRAPSPGALSRLLRADLRALPDMRDAMGSMLREYPEKYTGLSRLERKLLRMVEFLGISTPSYTVGLTLRTDLVGDTLLFDMLRTFIMARHPLLRFAEPFTGKITGSAFNRARIALTDTGRRVLAGGADHIPLNGIDRWIGGVHFSGHRVRWRWDERLQGIGGGRR